jgi:hypothetical protein
MDWQTALMQLTPYVISALSMLVTQLLKHFGVTREDLPLIAAGSGASIAMATGHFDATHAALGALCGLAATGVHQAVTQQQQKPAKPVPPPTPPKV